MSATTVPPPAPEFVLTPGPHLHAAEHTARIMWTVNATLAPAALWGVYVFGLPALLVLAGCIAGAVASEAFAARALGRRSSIHDGSAFCTGLLLAMTLPPSLPWWQALLGGAFAIGIGKMVFGGLGFNLFNPALLGRAFLMASFPLPMTGAWIAARAGFGAPLDAVTAATPLALAKEHGLAAGFAALQAPGGPWSALTLGFRGGSLGEVSALFIALGAVVLLARRIISLTTPLAVFAGLLLATLGSGAAGFHLFTGGLWLGAFFMATDYVTSPTTPRGQIVFGLLVGLLTGMIRRWGGYPEGICYAILIANALVPALDSMFRRRRVQLAGTPS
ncbi:MAG: RnfABCDGE type electron transport complex subunit D [Candidatus Eisenbacteria bacterium]